MKSMVPIWVCVVMLASFIILSNLGSGCCWIKTPKPYASCLAYYALHCLVLVIPRSVLVFKLLWIWSFLSSCCEEMHIFLVLWCDFIQFWFGSWLGEFEIHSFGLLSPFFFISFIAITISPFVLMAPMDERSSSVTSSPLQLFSMMSPSPSLGSPYPWLRELKSEERALYLIHLLLTCANHVASGSLENMNIAMEQISQLASVDGDTMQCIAAYFTKALADWIHLLILVSQVPFPFLLTPL